MRKGREEEEAGVAAGRRSSSSEEVLDPLEGRVEEPVSSGTACISTFLDYSLNKVIGRPPFQESLLTSANL